MEPPSQAIAAPATAPAPVVVVADGEAPLMKGMVRSHLIAGVDHPVVRRRL